MGGMLGNGAVNPVNPAAERSLETEAVQAGAERTLEIGVVKPGTERYWEALKEVNDPEFPVSVVDMGLIYGIDKEGGTVTVTMTYTAVSCACMEWIESDIEARLLKEPDVDSVRINVVWDPPWTVDRLSEEARRKLAHWGVSAR